MAERIIGVCYNGVDAARAQKITQAAQQAGYRVKFFGPVTADNPVPIEWMQDCEIIFGNIKPKDLVHAKALKWLQTSSAGVDAYCRPGILPEGVKLTNASGGYGVGIAEHALGQLLMLLKKSPGYLAQQKAHVWKSLGTVRPIYGSLVTVVGLGDIGSEFAKRMHALGAQVRGVKRRAADKPAFVDALYTTEQLDEALDGADVVFLSLPGTAATAGILNRQRIEGLKAGCIVLNVGRGSAIDQQALIEQLQNGHLGGAGLDVTVPEPLEAESPLWDMENVVISPHVSGGTSFDLTVDKIVDLFLKNLAAYTAGEPFARSVDIKEGY